MSYRGLMPPGQGGYPGQVQPQQQQAQQQQNGYASFGAQGQQQGQQGMTNGGGMGYGQQSNGYQGYYGQGGQHQMGYMQAQQQTTMQQQQQQQQRQAMGGYAGGMGMGQQQYNGYDAGAGGGGGGGYNPYVQQPSAAQYMPPPNVWQQQPQQQHNQGLRQMGSMGDLSGMGQMRASPVQQFDQLPPTGQGQQHQAQSHSHQAQQAQMQQQQQQQQRQSQQVQMAQQQQQRPQQSPQLQQRPSQSPQSSQQMGQMGQMGQMRSSPMQTFDQLPQDQAHLQQQQKRQQMEQQMKQQQQMQMAQQRMYQQQQPQIQQTPSPRIQNMGMQQTRSPYVQPGQLQHQRQLMAESPKPQVQQQQQQPQHRQQELQAAQQVIPQFIDPSQMQTYQPAGPPIRQPPQEVQQPQQQQQAEEARPQYIDPSQMMNPLKTAGPQIQHNQQTQRAKVSASPQPQGQPQHQQAQAPTYRPSPGQHQQPSPSPRDSPALKPRPRLHSQPRRQSSNGTPPVETAVPLPNVAQARPSPGSASMGQQPTFAMPKPASQGQSPAVQQVNRQVNNPMNNNNHQTFVPPPVPNTKSQPQPQTPQPARNQPQQQQQAAKAASSSSISEQQQQQQHQFVSMSDLQQMPLLPPASVESSSTSTDALKVKTEPSLDPLQMPTPVATAAAPAPTPTLSRSQAQHYRRDSEANMPIIKGSPHSSVAPSPAMSHRSLSMSTKRSPSVSSRSGRPSAGGHHSAPMLIAVAEEFLDKARGNVHDVAMSLAPPLIEEYHQLVSLAIGCFEAALQSGKLTPRQEARLRVRYAGVLLEETENVMECETSLTKGIALCDNHRIIDLKYCSQYLLMKVLFGRKRKAALKALDGLVNDCQMYKHWPWYYAFRLLKASLYMEAGMSSEPSAIDNLRALQATATNRGDAALTVYATLLEALTFLKSPSKAAANSKERIQTALAQVAKYQLDPKVTEIVQIEVLTLVVDIAANLNSLSGEVLSEKMRALQTKVMHSQHWGQTSSEFYIPVGKCSASGVVLSDVTDTIIRPGEDRDFLVVSFMTKMEFMSLMHTLAGLTTSVNASGGPKSLELWQESLSIIDGWDATTKGARYGPPVSLETAIRQRQWRVDMSCYLNITLGMRAASSTEWGLVERHITALANMAPPGKSPTYSANLQVFAQYLNAVYLQGTGDLVSAMEHLEQPCFALPRLETRDTPKGELSLLAALNRLWILQSPSASNLRTSITSPLQFITNNLDPLLSTHPSIPLKIAFSITLASLTTNPPQEWSFRKKHIHSALTLARSTGNQQQIAICLCALRNQMFENIVGSQALKSGQAAARVAGRGGNVVWMSVAGGMLGQSLEGEGRREEGAKEWERGMVMGRKFGERWPWGEGGWKGQQQHHHQQ